MKKTALLLAVTVSTALVGCNTDLWRWIHGDDGENEVARLQKFASPDELKSYLVGQNAQPDPPGRGSEWLVDDGVDTDFNAGGEGAPPADPSADGGNQGGDTPDHSSTTEQEAGVQEADVIKNDGQYLYVLSRNSLRIVQATPAAGMVEVGSVELDGYGQQMYLVDDKVVTITTPEHPVYLLGGAEPDALVADAYIPYRAQTEIAVIDVADRTNPTVIGRARLDGSINTSRMIGERLQIVAVNYPDVFVMPLLDEGVAATARSFADVDLDSILPDIVIEENGTETYRGNLVEFDDHYRPEDPDGLGLTSIVSMDINALGGYDAQTIVAYPANVYASTQALYVTDTAYRFNGEERETTDIYKFNFTESGVDQAAAGTIPGRVLNQYSMSEHNGFLRVAATKAATWGPLGQTSESTNHVFVLEQVDGELTLAGRVDDLAPGEQIFSARFLGEKGYVVTFEQVDPLFTIDLSDPRNPQVVGELKVPGFSTFITPMGENHLLTVGQHTDEDFGWTTGIRLSIFDVSDFANPTLAHVEVIGEDRGAWSEAVYDPKAFTYFAAGDLVALPIELYGNWGPEIDPMVDEDPGDGAGDDDAPPRDVDTNGDVNTNGDVDTNGVAPDPIDIDLPGSDPVEHFNGLYVYRVTAENGFEFLGGMNAISDDDNGYWYYYPRFIRGAFIGESVYCVTSEGVHVANVADVANILADVEFPQPDPGDDPGSGGGDDAPPPADVQGGASGSSDGAPGEPVEPAQPAEASASR